MLSALLILAAAAPQAPPSELSPVVVTAQPKDAPHADVTFQIGADQDTIGQVVQIWPARARKAGLSGYATLACFVDAHGLAERCRVIFETPQGEGFGGAALALRPTFKIPPPNDAAGAEMNLAVRFTAARTDSNLSDVMARAREVGLDGMPGQASEGVRNVNASGLVVRGNPVPMRSVTLAETPVWREAPGFAEVAAAYPAEGGGVEGYGVAHCRVEPTGLLSRCKAVKESPEKRGFGAAAVALAVRFRLSAEDVARAPRGAPLEVDVPVRFPAPAEAADRVVRAPLWVAGAEPEAAARHFPTEAAAKGVTEGEAVVRCEVAEDGSLQGCAPERARPDGFGFDDAALKVAAGMRMIPWSADAGPVKGGVVHIPVRFERGPPTP